MHETALSGCCQTNPNNVICHTLEMKLHFALVRAYGPPFFRKWDGCCPLSLTSCQEQSDELNWEEFHCLIFQGVPFQKVTKYVLEEIGFEEMHLFRVRRMCIDALDSFWCFSRASATTLISFSLNEKMKGDLLSVTDSSTSYFPETLQIRTRTRVSKGTTSNFVAIFQNFWIGYIWYLFCYRGETTQSKRSSHLDVFHCQAPCPRRICGSAVWRGLVSVNLEVYPRCYEGMVLVCDKSTRFKQLIMWCCEYRFPGQPHMHKQPMQPVCFQEPLAVPAPAALPAHSEALRIGDPLSTQGVSTLPLSDLPNGAKALKPSLAAPGLLHPHDLLQPHESWLNHQSEAIRLSGVFGKVENRRKFDQERGEVVKEQNQQKHCFYRTEPKGLQKDHVEALYKFSMIVLQVLNTCD